MTDGYILTGSFIVSCIEPSNPVSTKLLYELLVARRTGKVELIVTENLDEEFKEIFTKMGQPWGYEFIRKIYEPDGVKKKDDIEAVKSLANLRCELYEHLIIINDSNIFDDYKPRLGNVSVCGVRKSLDHLLKNN